MFCRSSPLSDCDRTLLAGMKESLDAWHSTPLHTVDYDLSIKSRFKSTPLTSEPRVAQIWSRYPISFEVERNTRILSCVDETGRGMYQDMTTQGTVRTMKHSADREKYQENTTQLEITIQLKNKFQLTCRRCRCRGCLRIAARHCKSTPAFWLSVYGLRISGLEVGGRNSA